MVTTLIRLLSKRQQNVYSCWAAKSMCKSWTLVTTKTNKQTNLVEFWKDFFYDSGSLCLIVDSALLASGHPFGPFIKPLLKLRNLPALWVVFLLQFTIKSAQKSPLTSLPNFVINCADNSCLTLFRSSKTCLIQKLNS